MKAANLITELAKVQINKRNSPEEMHFQQKKTLSFHSVGTKEQDGY